jgi:hypothetical protein
VPVSRVYTASEDTVALSASKILDVIQNARPRTLVQLHGAFYDAGAIGEKDLDMIFVNHGAFADIVERNYVHDSADEFVAQTGSSEAPIRLMRSSPPPGLPGSNLVSPIDASYLVAVTFENPYQAYSYDYPLEMEAGVTVPFKMPPPYYPSRTEIFLVSDGERSTAPALEFDSEEYWRYIRSNPEPSAVFKRIPASGSD